jgi:hypothetical protein
MAAILHKLPFFSTPTSLQVPRGPLLEIKHDQIIVWTSITRRETLELPPHARRFPTVLDTGFNDNFLIQEQQLVGWAGLATEELPLVDFLVAEGKRLPLRDANVWLYPNRPGFRDQFRAAQPFCLELDTGIAVWPSAVAGGRRLPLLGLRGLRGAELQLGIDFRKCTVSLRTPRRFWFF